MAHLRLRPRRDMGQGVLAATAEYQWCAGPRLPTWIVPTVTPLGTRTNTVDTARKQRKSCRHNGKGHPRTLNDRPVPRAGSRCISTH